MTEAEYQQLLEDNRIAARLACYFITDALAIRLGLHDYEYKYTNELRATNARAMARG